MPVSMPALKPVPHLCRVRSFGQDTRKTRTWKKNRNTRGFSQQIQEVVI
jgi:hypothetical protein